MAPMSQHLKQIKLKPDFYNCPDRFSFKDLLAIFFTLGFFYACYRALFQPQALELVKSIAYLMGIILGGYFGHEITAAIINEKHKNVNYTNSSSYNQDSNNI